MPPLRRRRPAAPTPAPGSPALPGAVLRPGCPRTRPHPGPCRDHARAPRRVLGADIERDERAGGRGRGGGPDVHPCSLSSRPAPRRGGRGVGKGGGVGQQTERRQGQGDTSTPVDSRGAGELVGGGSIRGGGLLLRAGYPPVPYKTRSGFCNPSRPLPFRCSGIVPGLLTPQSRKELPNGSTHLQASPVFRDSRGRERVLGGSPWGVGRVSAGHMRARNPGGMTQRVKLATLLGKTSRDWPKAIPANPVDTGVPTTFRSFPM